MKRVFAAIALMTLAACGGDEGTTLPSGSGTLEIVDVTVGTGATAVAGDTVSVHYIGSLTNGAVFDQSYNRGPFTFRLGTGAVIPGFDQAVTGMKVGGKRRTSIPPNLAYGSSGNGTIPPNATLLFEIELLSIAGK